MIKKKKSFSSKKKVSSSKDAENQTISLKDGWDRIYKLGVQPFFDRENVDDECNLEQTSIPQQQQYIATYDTIFSMCIQREPYKDSKWGYHRNAVSCNIFLASTETTDKLTSQSWRRKQRFPRFRCSKHGKLEHKAYRNNKKKYLYNRW